MCFKIQECFQKKLCHVCTRIKILPLSLKFSISIKIWKKKDRPSCSLPFNVLTLTTCSIKNFFPRHWLYVTKISLLKSWSSATDVNHTFAWHNFFWKHSWILQNFRRERTVFHFNFKENENLRRFFSIFEVRGGNLKKKSGKRGR
jgi:hypothetical protein